MGNPEDCGYIFLVYILAKSFFHCKTWFSSLLPMLFHSNLLKSIFKWLLWAPKNPWRLFIQMTLIIRIIDIGMRAVVIQDRHYPATRQGPQCNKPLMSTHDWNYCAQHSVHMLYVSVAAVEQIPIHDISEPSHLWCGQLPCNSHGFSFPPAWLGWLWVFHP